MVYELQWPVLFLVAFVFRTMSRKLEKSTQLRGMLGKQVQSVSRLFGSILPFMDLYNGMCVIDLFRKLCEPTESKKPANKRRG